MINEKTKIIYVKTFVNELLEKSKEFECCGINCKQCPFLTNNEICLLVDIVPQLQKALIKAKKLESLY